MVSLASLFRRLPPNEGDPWQFRSTLFQIAGITTQGTPYTVGTDAVGIGQLLPEMGGPQHTCILHNMILYFDAVPTTSQAGIIVGLYNQIITPQADNAALAIPDVEQTKMVGAGTFGGLQFPTNLAAVGNSTSLAISIAGAAIVQPLPTMDDGSLWMQCACSSAFTAAANGIISIRFNYRWGNFQGYA